jgi:hypothetical protein
MRQMLGDPVEMVGAGFDSTAVTSPFVGEHTALLGGRAWS